MTSRHDLINSQTSSPKRGSGHKLNVNKRLLNFIEQRILVGYIHAQQGAIRSSTDKQGLTLCAVKNAPVTS